MNEDHGWLGVGGGFDNTRGEPGLQERFFGFMDRVMRASRVLGQAGNVESWRAETGLRSLYLVLEQSSDYDEPEVELISTTGGTRTYSVAYDWLSSTFADNRVGPWIIAGHLSLVLGTISKQDDIPLPVLERWLPPTSG